MSDVLNKASLILIPSGYKQSKLYSQIPENGSGDLTFSRASTATRVNSEGLIEKARTNFLLQSNTFDTTWSLSNGTLTGGQTGYDGSTDAWQFDASGTAQVSQSVSTSGVQTYSIYAKAGTENGIFLRANGGNNPRCFFNLDSGTIGIEAGGLIDSNIEDIGNGWYRCSIVYSDTTNQPKIYVADNSNGFPSTGNILIQDAQLENGLVATDYIETTTAAVSVGITADIPRLDYTNSSCPALLLEPQRTNIIKQSEYFIGSNWNNFAGITPITNSLISPEGVENASTLECSGNSVYRYQFTATSSTDYVGSIFVKAKETTNDFGIQTLESGTAYTSVFDIENGIVISEGANHTSLIEDYGNGWYRCIVKFNSGTSTSNIFDLKGSQTSTKKDFYAYGAMLEAGSYASSYIPTYGASVTRGADASSDNDLVNTPISFGSNDDFTLFYEGSFNDLSSTSNMIMGGGRQQLGASYKNYWWIQNATSMRITGDAEVLMASASISLTDNTNHKLLVKRDGSTIDFFVDGSKLTTTQSTPNTAFVFRSLGWSYTNAVYKVSGDIKQAIVFNQALTDDECIQLTTL